MQGHGFDPWSEKIPHALRHNYWVWALQPPRHNYWAHVPYSLCSAMREAMATRSLCTATKSSPPLTTTKRKPTHSKQDPAQPKIHQANGVPDTPGKVRQSYEKEEKAEQMQPRSQENLTTPASDGSGKSQIEKGKNPNAHWQQNGYTMVVYPYNGILLSH